MKRVRLWIVMGVATALSLFVVTGAAAQPAIPASFTGTVNTVDGPAATGLSVVAEIDGQNCNVGDSRTYRQGGATRYTVIVNSDGAQSGCGAANSVIRFRIGGDYAAQTVTWERNAPPLQRLNLTVGDGVAIDVTVWESVSTGNVYVSTRPPGDGWTTHNIVIDLSNLSSSGNFYQGTAVPIEVQLEDGSTANIDVTVWRSVRTGNTFVSTQPEGRGWTTHNTPIDLSNLSGTGRFYQGSPVTVLVASQ